MFQEYSELGTLKKSGFEDYDSHQFPSNVEKIILHKVQFRIKKEHEKKGYVIKKIAICIDLHCYNGFSMIKFYPKRFKNHKEKYKMRCREIGYRLSVSEIRHLLAQCSNIMKNYLNKNNNNLVGYIAQPDQYDDLKERLNSHRSIIYNPFIKSVFQPDKYDVTSKNHPLKNFNISMVRNILYKNTPERLNDDQIRNLNNLNTILTENYSELPNFMTKRRRIHVFGNDIVHYQSKL